jgi:hypothetical protein
MHAYGTPMGGVRLTVLPKKFGNLRCSEMRFQANPDDIKSLVTRLTYHTYFTAIAIIIGKTKKIKG